MSKKGFTLVEVLLSLSITLLIVLNCSLLVKVLKISNQSKYIDTSLENAIFSLSNELITAKNIEYGDSLSFLDENDDSHKIILQNKQNKCIKYNIEILKIENGTRKKPSWEHLCKIAKALNFHPFEVLLNAGYDTYLKVIFIHHC